MPNFVLSITKVPLAVARLFSNSKSTGSSTSCVIPLMVKSHMSVVVPDFLSNLVLITLRLEVGNSSTLKKSSDLRCFTK